jgi:hypothetical protein
MVVKLFAAVGACGTHIVTKTDIELGVHTVATNMFAADAATGVQAATGVGPLRVVVLHVVCVQLLPAFSAAAVQVATLVGPVLLVEHVVVTQPLPAAAADAVHV